MGQSRLEQLESMAAAQPENALFQYTLGLEYLKTGQPQQALGPLRQAIRLKEDYSAAYRELGRALEKNAPGQAAGIYRKGIEVAEQQGDIQTAKEMRVFLKRLEKQE